MVFEKLKRGDAVDMFAEEYAPAVEELNRSSKICWRIGQTEPNPDNIRPLLKELLFGKLPDSSYIMPPVQIDFGMQVSIAENVFINHSLTLMSAGGIEIGEGTQIGPQVTMVTTNHDFSHRNVLNCRGIKIGRNVWIGARATIMPGVTVGDNAVIAGGALVVKDVTPDTVVGGVPAKFLKTLK